MENMMNQLDLEIGSISFRSSNDYGSLAFIRMYIGENKILTCFLGKQMTFETMLVENDNVLKYMFRKTSSIWERLV